jgi:antitoxin YefM
MIAVKTLDVTQDFKSIAERIMQGEIVLISRPKNENIVMITETEYNQLNKLRETIAEKQDLIKRQPTN